MGENGKERGGGGQRKETKIKNKQEDFFFGFYQKESRRRISNSEKEGGRNEINKHIHKYSKVQGICIVFIRRKGGRRIKEEKERRVIKLKINVE